MGCQRKRPSHISLSSMLLSRRVLLSSVGYTNHHRYTDSYWFQAACNPRSPHGCKCSAMLHLLLYVVKRQLTICFKSSQPIQIGLCTYADIFEHLPSQLASRRPIRSDVTSVDTITQTGQPDNCYRPHYSTARLRSRCHTRSLMNRFRAGQGSCRANLHKWGLTQSPFRDCGQRQTMNHTVDTCP